MGANRRDKSLLYPSLRLG